MPLHWFLFDRMVTARWGIPWTVPLKTLAMIILVMTLASIAAIVHPAKQIKKMSVTDVIHSQ